MARVRGARTTESARAAATFARNLTLVVLGRTEGAGQSGLAARAAERTPEVPLRWWRRALSEGVAAVTVKNRSLLEAVGKAFGVDPGRLWEPGWARVTLGPEGGGLEARLGRVELQVEALASRPASPPPDIPPGVLQAAGVLGRLSCHPEGDLLARQAAKYLPPNRLLSVSLDDDWLLQEVAFDVLSERPEMAAFAASLPLAFVRRAAGSGKRRQFYERVREAVPEGLRKDGDAWRRAAEVEAGRAPFQNDTAEAGPASAEPAPARPPAPERRAPLAPPPRTTAADVARETIRSVLDEDDQALRKALRGLMKDQDVFGLLDQAGLSDDVADAFQFVREIEAHPSFGPADKRVKLRPKLKLLRALLGRAAGDADSFHDAEPPAPGRPMNPDADRSRGRVVRRKRLAD